MRREKSCKGTQIEIRGDNKTVDWPGVAVGKRQKTFDGVVGQCRRFEEQGDDWAVHIYREHNQEADAWAEKGARGQTEGWEDETDFVWSQVTRICWVWDGKCAQCRLKV